MSGHPPTEEQAYAIELGKAGGHAVLQAGAGCGKTSTLVFIAEATPTKRSAFNAFNASIRDDAREKFPSHTDCATLHGRAHTAIVKGTPFIKRLGGGKKRLSPFDMAKMLRAKDLYLSTPFGAKRLSSGFLASLAGKTVDNFCRSADVQPSPWHVPRQEGLDEPTTDGRRGPVMNEVAQEVAALAKTMWADIINSTGVMPFDHGHYLKMWQLDDPKINADIVFVDEAQDLNGCMMAIAENQMKHAQLIVVGDSQQAIYGWNGAVDALDKFGIDDVAWLTQSFRFGPAVAEVANQVLEQLGAQLRLTGFEPRQSVVTGVRDGKFTLLGRTNALVVSNALNDIRAGRKVHVVGGAKDVISFAEAAAKLQAGQTTWHHDLACFSTWGEAQDYCVGMGTKILTRDLRWVAAEELFVGSELIGFDEENPAGGFGRKYRPSEVTATKILKRPCVEVKVDTGQESIVSIEHRFLVQSGRNLRWKQAENLAPGDRIVSVGPPWEPDLSYGGGWLAGMYDGEGCVVGNGRSKARAISLAQNEGVVLAQARVLLAERGYEWSDSPNSAGTRQLTMWGGLSRHLRLLGTLRPLRLLEKSHKLWDGARVESRALATVTAVTPVGVQEVVSLTTSTATFIADGLLSHNCQNDPMGEDLKLLVRLVDTYGADVLRSVLKDQCPEDQAEALYSTAHKAKGREWDRVRIGSDFTDPEKKEISDEEKRLTYVAVTRAMQELDVADVPLLNMKKENA